MDSAPTRRHRSRKACDLCRHKKRRCNHQLGLYSGPDSASGKEYVFCSMSPNSNRIRKVPRNPRPNPEFQLPGPAAAASHVSPAQDSHGTSSPVQPQSPELARGIEVSEEELHTVGAPDSHAVPSSPRFVGDLNPEARLLDKTTSPEDAQSLAPGEVGVWIRPPKSGRGGVNINSDRRTSLARYAPFTMGSGRIFPPISNLMSEETIQQLSEVYFASIHSLIPLLNKDEYWELLSQRTIPTPLVHTVCLLAGKDHSASNYLRLLHSGNTILSVRQFCSQLYISICSALSQRNAIRKVTLMRIYGLLSLHQEGADGAELSSSYMAQATHSAQSLALHQPRPGDVDNDLQRTFWCLWTLDRLNAATNSRPCLMADIDIAVPDISPDETGYPAFNVLFRIVKCLNTVIGLYRPKAGNQGSGVDSGFPAFEQIIDEMHAWQLLSSTIATLHIFYLTTAILAHRLKTITTLPSPTPSRLRQQLSAIQVIRYMRDPTRLKTLRPLPVVVYATSLALSVSYQQLRYSRLPSDQEDAREDFNAACGILQELRCTWASADAMALLAQRISTALNELPSLDLLRVVGHAAEVNGHQEPQQEGAMADASQVHDQPPPGETEEQHHHHHHHQGLHLDGAHISHIQGTELPQLDAMDLFSGMDDVSWMYLDAENPVNFDGFPFAGLGVFDEQHGVW
ncbi:hypothetical protein BJX65DRAFT_316928 [Aspergillus insuetus]